MNSEISKNRIFFLTAEEKSSLKSIFDSNSVKKNDCNIIIESGLYNKLKLYAVRRDKFDLTITKKMLYKTNNSMADRSNSYSLCCRLNIELPLFELQWNKSVIIDPNENQRIKAHIISKFDT